jgi:hypothetical protein
VDFAGNARLLRRLFLATDVDGGRRIVAGQNDVQAWRSAVGGPELGDAARDFLADSFGNFLAVDELCHSKETY